MAQAASGGGVRGACTGGSEQGGEAGCEDDGEVGDGVDGWMDGERGRGVVGRGVEKREKKKRERTKCQLMRDETRTTAKQKQTRRRAKRDHHHRRRRRRQPARYPRTCLHLRHCTAPAKPCKPSCPAHAALLALGSMAQKWPNGPWPMGLGPAPPGAFVWVGGWTLAPGAWGCGGLGGTAYRPCSRCVQPAER